MDTTCFEIKTVYSREDLEGLYDAFLSGEKSARISKKITKAASTFGAILFWAFAALTLISNLFTGSLYIFLIAFSMSAVIALLGWLMFFMGNRRFRSKAVWNAYPNKGEQILFRFSSDGFLSTQGHLETKVSYAGIVRLCQDSQRLYLFTSSQVAYILPKRDFIEQVDAFREFRTCIHNLKRRLAGSFSAMPR